MKVGAYSTLIVAVILGVVLTTSLMVPVIANVDAGQTEERLVPTDVTNGELFDARDHAPDGYSVIYYEGGIITGSFYLPYSQMYIDNAYIDGTYYMDVFIRAAHNGYECKITATINGSEVQPSTFFVTTEDAALYGISDQGQTQIYMRLSVGGGTLYAQAIIGNSGNIDDRPAVYLTIIPQGVVAYMGTPELTTNGYLADQVMLSQGLTTSATTQAYYVNGFTPSEAQVVDVITTNNTLVGYLDEQGTQPVYMFNESKDIDTFAPNDGTFLGVERVGYTDYYNVKDVTIYEKKDVPVDSPIKWVLAIIPVMVLVGIVVFVINTQIVQKRD